MRISLNTSEQPEGIRWYDNIWASLIFFTRLPWWRLHQPPQECYRTVVEHWPLAGWLTGGAMAAVIYFGNDIFSHSTTVILAIITKTGWLTSSTVLAVAATTAGVSSPS